VGLSWQHIHIHIFIKRESYAIQPRIQRILWGLTIFLALIGVAVVLRRTLLLALILINGYKPPVATGSSTAAQFAALDDIFARYPLLTLIHILPALLFMILGPLQFNATIRLRHPQWHRWSGRLYLLCSLIVGLTALVMSFAMPAIAAVNQATATTLFAILFLFLVGQSLLAYLAPPNCPTSRVDDSRFCNWPGSCYHPSYHR